MHIMSYILDMEKIIDKETLEAASKAGVFAIWEWNKQISDGMD